MPVQRGSKDVDLFDAEHKTGLLGSKASVLKCAAPASAGGQRCLSADVDNICWLLITVGNFTQTERSVFAHVCMCVNTVLFAEGGTGELSDSTDVFDLVGAGSRSFTTEELQSHSHTWRRQKMSPNCSTVETALKNIQ